MLLDIKNDSDSEKKLKVFPYVEWCLWDADDDQKKFQRNLSTGEVEIESNLGYEISGLKKPASTSIDNYSELEYAAIYHRTEYRERRNMYAVFSASLNPRICIVNHPPYEESPGHVPGLSLFLMHIL